MILTYNVGDEVEYRTRSWVPTWVPARVITVHHEDDGQSVPFTYIKLRLYNGLTHTCYEPEIKAFVRKRSDGCVGTCTI